MRYSPIYNSYGASELKRSYQKNLVMAQLVALSLVALIIGSIVLLNRLTREETVIVTLREMDRSVHVINLAMEQPKPVKRSVNTVKPEKPRPLGFLDKISVNPVVAEPIPLDSAVVYSDKPAADGDAIQSYSDLIGDTGVGVYHPASLPLDTVTGQRVVACSVLTAVEPEYPWVARERNIEGAAGIIVCVDETGRVSLFADDIVRQFRERRLAVEKMVIKVERQKRQFNYVVTYEEPAGWFFARKVAEAVSRWVFEPSTVDGRPVKSLLPIGHAFCLTEECTYKHVVLLNYRQFKPTTNR